MLYRFAFERRMHMRDVEDILLVATITMGTLHQVGRVRPDVAVYLNPERRTVIIDGRSDYGRDVAKVFKALCLRAFDRRHIAIQETPVPKDALLIALPPLAKQCAPAETYVQRASRTASRAA